MNSRPPRGEAAEGIRDALGLFTLVAAAGALGALLAAAAAPFDERAPLVVLALALVPVAAAAVLADSRFGVVLVFAAFPIGFSAVSVGLFELQATDAAVLIATVVVVLKRVAAGRTPLLSAWHLGWAVALTVWSLALVSSAIDQELAIRRTGSLVSGVVLCAVVITVCRSLDDIRRLLGALIAVGLVIAVPAIVTSGQLRSYYSGGLVIGRPEGVFVEPNELGTFCSMTFLAAVGLMLGARARLARLASAVAALVLFTGLALSLSRGAWLGTLAGAALLLLTLRSARRFTLVAVGLAGLVLVVGNVGRDNAQVQVVEERVQAFANIDQPYENRRAIWAEAVRQLEEDPWTGQGPGNFAISSRRHASASLTVYAAHAHDIYLNIAAELGLPGVSLLLALIASLAFAARQTLRALPRMGQDRDRAVVAGVAAALLSLAALGVFHSFLGNAIIDATIWSLVGFLLAAWRLRGPEPEQPSARPRPALTA